MATLRRVVSKIVDVVGMRRTGGAFSKGCNAMRTLRSIDVRMRGNSVCKVVKFSKTNGSALVQLMGKLRAPSAKGIVIRKRGLKGLGGARLHGLEEGVKVIFRRFGLLRSGAICRGVTLPLVLRGTPGRRVSGGMGRMLQFMRLRSGGSICMDRLSKKRGREIKVTETLAAAPSVLLYSRTADTLSPRAARSVLGLLGGVGQRVKIAVLLVARRVRIIRVVYGGMTIVRGKRMMRTKDILSMFKGPRAPIAEEFIRAMMGSRVPRDVVDLIGRRGRRFQMRELGFVKDDMGHPMVSSVYRISKVMMGVLKTAIRRLRRGMVYIFVLRLVKTRRGVLRTRGRVSKGKIVEREIRTVW